MEDHSNSDSSGRSHVVTAIALVAVGLALAATGIYVGEVDDAPGAAVIGLVLMICAVTFAVRLLRPGRWRRTSG